MELEHGHYMILCINLNKLQYSKFELEIHSNTRVSNCISHNNFYLKKKNFDIFGKWEKQNAGGGPNYGSFLKNPQYMISPSRSTDYTIELISQNGYEICFIVIPIDRHYNYDMDIDLNVIKDYLKNQNIPSMVKTMEECCIKKMFFESSKKYILIPYTSEPAQVCNLFLLISVAIMI